MAYEDLRVMLHPKGMVPTYVGKLQDYAMFADQALGQLARKVPADGSTRSMKIAGEISQAQKFVTQLRQQADSLSATVEEIAGEVAMEDAQ